MNILLRAGRLAFTLWLVTTAVFFAMRISSDPTQYLVAPGANEQLRAEVANRLGLTHSSLYQYIQYLKHVALGDFGVSYFSGRPVAEVFLERLPTTLLLTVPSLIVAILIGVPVGIVCAVNHNGVIDRALLLVSFLSQATPAFVLGIGLILLFCLWLNILPSGGVAGPASLILPVLTLGTAIAASVARLTRNSMLEILRMPFMEFARSKGLPRATVILKHGLRNALIPIVTIIGLQLGGLIGGAVVVETVFAWPGAGSLLVDAVIRGDYPLLQFGILLVATTITMANMLVDESYRLLDPRIATGRKR
ncbi:ABC transporter permease [Sinorhizobium meliloti]|uniref:ABC transporter permease n=1 Tax=Rhizobium meliloti TaxID=382 RepID=UPI000FD73973|nr:ABC transporter permease [Sinorhizobium meliloti]RVM17879.1 ABC transporter permease [Sinorhizobium meliloti]RVO34211.1 ABC transporter permease [Sinorhizobium meliloti]